MWIQTVNGAERAYWRDRAVGAIESAEPQGVTSLTIGTDQINRLRKAMRCTSQLANQLLALSHVDAHSAKTESLQRIDLVRLCEVLLEMYLDVATSKYIDFELEVAAVHLTGHEWLLRELMTNLTGNALKYLPW